MAVGKGHLSPVGAETGGCLIDYMNFLEEKDWKGGCTNFQNLLDEVSRNRGSVFDRSFSE